MEIKQQDLETFASLCKKAYGVTLSSKEAEQELLKLLQLYTLIYLTPVPSPESVKAMSALVHGRSTSPPRGSWYNADATHKIIN